MSNKDQEEPTPLIPLTHRDDFPFPVSEVIVEHFQKLFPGVQVRFAGDVPEGEMPPEMLAEIIKVDRKMINSMVDGLCMDCGRKMPGEWPLFSDDFQVPEGWSYYEAGELCFFICPECEAKTPTVNLTPEDSSQEESP